jgi:hypothetical protein
MSRPLFLPLAGFEVTLNGRFWVTAEVAGARTHSAVGMAKQTGQQSTALMCGTELIFSFLPDAHGALSGVFE